MRKPPFFGYGDASSLVFYLVRKNIELSRNTVKSWENGKLPNGNTIRQVAVALKLTPAELYNWIIIGDMEELYVEESDSLPTCSDE